MKCIINNKIYDSEKATEIIKYKQKIEHKNIFGSIFPYHHAKILKTNKGTYLKYIGGCTDNVSYSNYESLEIITEKEVKTILAELNAVDKYIELFENLEEG